MNEEKNPKFSILLLRNIVIGVLFVALTVYVLYQVILVLKRGYATETAILYNMSDSVNVTGLLSFEEQYVMQEADEIGYLVSNGDRVSNGTALAEIYNDSVQPVDRAEYLRLLNLRSVLEKSNNNTMDVNNLITLTENDAINVLEKVDFSQYDALNSAEASYFVNANKLNYTLGRISNFEEKTQILNEQITELSDRLDSAEKILSSTSGYFIDSSHAQMLDYNRDDLDEMSPVETKEAIETPSYNELPEHAIGKIITDYVWQFYCVCDSETAKRIEESSALKISFPEYSEQKFSAVVQSILTDDEKGISKIVLKCDFLNSEISSFTLKTANFEFESFEGIRIPVRALHIVNGNKGVYVKYGNLAFFRQIDILYQDEDYILIPAVTSATNEIKLYDEIITEGYGLRDGKMLA